MTRVKICGITSLSEALLAERNGADAIGVLVGRLHVSPDFISPELAAEICSRLPPFLTSVFVTHLEDSVEIIRLAELIPARALQIHSDVPRSVLQALRERIWPRKLIGKISIMDESALLRAHEIETAVDAIVLDSADPKTNRVGGTGIVHDWSISARIVSEVKIPVILAGGLNPENVAAAIAAVKLWAVDVHSGVEMPDGKKCEKRIGDFIKTAHAT